jgi:hypothetical protein
VRQPERIALGAVDGDGFLIVLSRSLAAIEVSLNLTQAGERLRQLHSDASLATGVHRLDQVASGIVQPALSSRLQGLA